MAATLERLIVRSPTKKSYWLLLSAAYFELDRDEEARSIVQLAYRQGLLDQDREIRALARLLLSNGLPYEAGEGDREGDGRRGGSRPERHLRAAHERVPAGARGRTGARTRSTKGADLAEDAQLYMLLGKVHLQRDRYQEAVAALNQGLAKAKPEQRAPRLPPDRRGAARRQPARRRRGRLPVGARGDEKVRTEAESYIKFVTQERARRREMGA